jgi:hypothetical protein
MAPEASNLVFKLNGDIVELIVERTRPDISFNSPNFSLSNDVERPYRFFAGLCLVSKMWLTPARRQLYRVLQPFIRTHIDYSSLFLTLDDNPDIRLYVLRMHMDLNSRFDARPFDILRSLPRCTLLATQWDPEHSRVRYLDSLIAENKLSVLKIAEVGWDAVSFRRGFATWAALHELRICGVPAKFPDPDESVIFSERNAKLPSLRILKLQEQFEFLCIPPTTSNTLHTFVLHECGDISSSLFFAFIRHHSASLRRLFMNDVTFEYRIYTDAAGDSDQDELPSVLDNIGKAAPHLELVYVHDTPHFTQSIYASLPLCVIEVSLHFPEGTIKVEIVSQFIQQHSSLGGGSLKFFALQMPDILNPRVPAPVSWTERQRELLDLSKYEPAEWEVPWLTLQKLAEERGVDYTCTVSGPSHRFLDIRSIGTKGPLQFSHRGYGSGPGRGRDPVWSEL